MTRTYLFPQRRRFEILSAMFAAGFGLHIWALSYRSNPLVWAGLSVDEALTFGCVMATFGMIHSIGVHINGRWRWSPVLRLIGLLGHTFAFAFLASRGAGQTAVYTYTWGFVLMLYGAWSAAVDVRAALIGGAEWSRN